MTAQTTAHRTAPPPGSGDVRVPYPALLEFTAALFARLGMAEPRARDAAEALCYGDLTGHASHGMANLTRLYLPLFDAGRVDPGAEPRVLADRGAAVLLDGARALGLWLAGHAMDLAVRRAAAHGVGLVSVRGATHFGCAGHHAVRAVAHGMLGLLAGNCGAQRLARPPGGTAPLLGTNPLSLAAPAGDHHPFVLDMSTTAAPTGKIRAAARSGRPVPVGWLADEHGRPVTDPTAYDRGEAHLQWLGGPAGAYKGFGLGLAVEVLAALVSGSACGPAALSGEHGRDDDIGLIAVAVAPAALRTGAALHRDADALFGAVLDCPPADPAAPVRYPGWHEARTAAHHRRHGVPLPAHVHAEVRAVAARFGLAAPPAEEAA